jgi:hypothetical protein
VKCPVRFAGAWLAGVRVQDGEAAGVYTGVPGERRLPLLAADCALETDGTPALGLGPLIIDLQEKMPIQIGFRLFE